MLLSITTTHSPASDLGYLLHKHPDRFQSFEMSFGKAHVFYPEASDHRCTACLLLDVDSVSLVRDKSRNASFLQVQYVSDRPYVASSFMSTAIAQVFGAALNGQCKDRPELAKTPIPLEAKIDVLPVRAGEHSLQELFEPLGYEVTATRYPLDVTVPEWGASPYYSVSLKKTTTLAELLSQLYVLIPVFDNRKHYYVEDAEIEKLLAKGGDWLAAHPMKDFIARRYLRHQANLYRDALARLSELQEEPEADTSTENAVTVADEKELAIERPISLHQQRIMTVLAALRASGARTVIDLGCGQGRLLRELLADRQFEKILGVDVSLRSLEMAESRLKLDRLPELQRQRIQLKHGSLLYRDSALSCYDAAALIEVIEHLDPPRLAAMERTLFEFARPKTLVITTPNREYNVTWETLPAGAFRHSDHRFEWTREEFQTWANTIAARYNYSVRFLPIGPEHPQYGPPSQMATFTI
jgi:3' terminal RNA ribose 2'-O-methyltransferase Hen1